MRISNRLYRKGKRKRGGSVVARAVIAAMDEIFIDRSELSSGLSCVKN